MLWGRVIGWRQWSDQGWRRRRSRWGPFVPFGRRARVSRMTERVVRANDTLHRQIGILHWPWLESAKNPSNRARRLVPCLGFAWHGTKKARVHCPSWVTIALGQARRKKLQPFCTTAAATPPAQPL